MHSSGVPAQAAGHTSAPEGGGSALSGGGPGHRPPFKRGVIGRPEREAMRDLAARGFPVAAISEQLHRSPEAVTRILTGAPTPQRPARHVAPSDDPAALLKEIARVAEADPSRAARLASRALDALKTKRARISAASKKMWEDPEVRARISAARKKMWEDPEVRARISAARKKALQDPEVRARISAASKKMWEDPEVRARISAARKKALQDPEVRATLEAGLTRALRRRILKARGLEAREPELPAPVPRPDVVLERTAAPLPIAGRAMKARRPG